MTSYAPTTHSRPRCVGVLYEKSSPEDLDKQCLDCKIYANEHLLIGRDSERCHYVVHDPTVSGKHIRIYTILVDQEESSEIAPLVYAEDLSRYGTYWNGLLMGKGKGGFLLSDGDVLQITKHLELVFRSCLRDEPEGAFNELLEEEMDVWIPLLA